MDHQPIHVIPFDGMPEQPKRAAFVIMYARDGRPWADYDGAKPELRRLMIPTCLMLNRADGAIGFVGGKVDGDETLEEAVRREVAEEIGHRLQGDLERLVAHDLGPISTHAFALEMPYADLRRVQVEATQADHFGSEITGVLLAHLIDYASVGKRGGLVNLLGSQLAPTVREEMVHFLLKKDLVQEETLAALIRHAGYDLVDLVR